MALDARKFDVSENYNHNRTNGNKLHMRENLTARIFLTDLDARKFSCAKISTFTVFSSITCNTTRVLIHELLYKRDHPLNVITAREFPRAYTLCCVWYSLDHTFCIGFLDVGLLLALSMITEKTIYEYRC